MAQTLQHNQNLFILLIVEFKVSFNKVFWKLKERKDAGQGVERLYSMARKRFMFGSVILVLAIVFRSGLAAC
ncbi:MAG: hypothetical protein CMI17_09490 [Opitutaceae bacterium]|nr:hypothetical protein [Opitutaceae bacterium]